MSASRCQPDLVAPDQRALGLTALDLLSGDLTGDEAELAAAFGSAEAVATGALYLAGFAVQALAAERSESVAATVERLRRLLSGDDGGGGVREPRRPQPDPGALDAEAVLPQF
jgi:hypothetical protein